MSNRVDADSSLRSLAATGRTLGLRALVAPIGTTSRGPRTTTLALAASVTKSTRKICYGNLGGHCYACGQLRRPASANTFRDLQ